MNQYYAPFFSLLFSPSPFFLDSYGATFKNLLQMRSQQFPYSYREHRQVWCIANSQMPSFTFIPYYVNLPVFKFPTQLHVFNQLPIKFKQNVMINKNVQTDDRHVTNGNAINQYSQNYGETSTHVSMQATVASANSQTIDFTIIEDSQDYNPMWPSTSNNTVNSNNQLIKYNNNLSNDILDQSSQNIGAFKKLPSWTPKPEPDFGPIGASLVTAKQDFSYLGASTSTSNLNMSNLLQDTSNNKVKAVDDYWYTNFPALKTLPTTLMTKGEIDEEFGLIESVIGEDILEDDGTLDWWNNNKQ